MQITPEIRHNWTVKEVETLSTLPLLELISKAHRVHLHFHNPSEIQVCHLISVKTGGCPEDCKYCAQSSRYQTSISAQPLMEYETVLRQAKKAIAQGATRICLGAAWRRIRDGKPFEEILKMIQGIAELGVEVCVTLGMLTSGQAKKLKEAGLFAYNHNLDTSETFYPQIITTRSYQDRLNTLDIVEKEALSVCCGGIIGLGETLQDRIDLLLTLSTRDPHPESIPINQLSQIPGTPLANQPQLPIWDVIRMVAMARILLPRSMIRLSCGRIYMSEEAQALCFLAGSNSIFAGEKLLTVANTSQDQDKEMFKNLGLTMRPAYKKSLAC